MSLIYSLKSDGETMKKLTEDDNDMIKTKTIAISIAGEDHRPLCSVCKVKPASISVLYCEACHDKECGCG